VEIMALGAKIIVVLRTKIIVSTDSGDSGDSTDSGWWDGFCFFHGWQYVKGLLCWGAWGKGNTLLYLNAISKNHG
jgi:hypothetical protein